MDMNEIIAGCAKARADFDSAWEGYAQKLTDYAMEVCAEIESAGMLDTKICKYTVTRSDNHDGSIGYCIKDIESIQNLYVPIGRVNAMMISYRIPELARVWKDFLEAKPDGANA